MRIGYVIATAMFIAGPAGHAAADLTLKRADSVIARDGGSSRGVAWGDFDNDGDADLAISNTDNQALFIYRNLGGGRFRRMNLPPFDEFKGSSEGIAWVDFDNDGRLDLFVARTDGPNRLYRNRGGAFSAVDGGALTADNTVSSQGCWADFDRDGRLDVFVVNRGGQDDVLYQNLGKGRFRARPDAFTGRGGDGRTCAAGDVDGNGWPDIYVGNFLEPGADPPRKAANSFYLNRGDRFEPVEGGHVVSTPSLTYGASFEDVDQDGDLDLFVTNISLSDRNWLYENSGSGEFRLRDDLSLSSDSLGPSKGHAWGDFDNDGDLDLVIAEGTENITDEQKAAGYDVRNRLFLNDGKGGFASAEAALTADAQVSAGVAAADHDLDGDLDIAVANWGGNAEDNAFYENGGGGRWIGLALQGRRSNRQGIGAHAEVTITRDTGRTVLHRFLWPQTGYASMNEPVLHFGLGAAKKIDRIRITWPSGHVDEYDDLPINVRFRATEGAKALQVLNSGHNGRDSSK